MGSETVGWRVGSLDARLECYGEELEWLEGLRVVMSSGEAYTKVISRMMLLYGKHGDLRRELYDLISGGY